MTDDTNRDLLAPEPPTHKAVCDTFRRQLSDTFDKALADVKAQHISSGVIGNPDFPVACLFIVHPSALAFAATMHHALVAMLGEPGKATLQKITPTEDKPAPNNN